VSNGWDATTLAPAVVERNIRDAVGDKL